MMAALHSFLKLWEESTSKVIPVIGWIQFHEAVGLRSPFPCCWSAKVFAPSWSLLLEAAHIPSHAFHVVPLQQQLVESLSCFKSPRLSHCCIFTASSWKKILCFQEFVWLGWSTQRRQNNLPIFKFVTLIISERSLLPCTATYLQVQRIKAWIFMGLLFCLPQYWIIRPRVSSSKTLGFLVFGS